MSLEKLKKVLKEKEVTVGTNETLRKVKGGKVSIVFLAKDCKPLVRKQMEHYAKLKAVELLDLDVTAAELGTICKKQYPVSILSY